MRCAIITRPIEVRGIRIGCGIPKIIVPIVGETRTDILTEAEKIADAKADVIEWRADFYETVRNANALPEMLAELRAVIGEIPVIFTIRTSNEGGKIDISDDDYAELLKAAALSGNADMIDVELFRFSGKPGALVRSLQQAGALTILSNHEFHSTPEKAELLNRLRMMEEAGADILKIAVMPQTRTDVLTLLEATLEMAEHTESAADHDVHERAWLCQPPDRGDLRFCYDFRYCRQILGTGTDPDGGVESLFSNDS